MKLEYIFSIAGVDGQTQMQYKTENPAEIADFALRHDHEGSSITLTVHGYNEDAYKLLTELTILEKQPR